MKIEWKETEVPASGGRRVGSGDETKLVVYSSVRHHKKGTPTDIALVVVVPETLMRSAGLRIGDRIKFVESDGMVAILRDNDGSHKLGARCGNGESKKKVGQVVRAQVSRKLTDVIRAVWLGDVESREEKAVTGNGFVAISKAKQ